MWTPSRGSNARRTGHRRIAECLADDQATNTDTSDNESFTTAYGDEFFAAGSGGGGMLPAFLADQEDLVEVMLELDEESMVVRSVTPTRAALYSAAAMPHTPEAPGGGGGALSRCSSTSSRIRKKFAWLRSPSPAPSPSPRVPTPAELQREAAMAARERRRIQARVNRSRAGAKRALKGLRFISRTTGSLEAAELWRRVEERFNALAHDGLLSRDNFGECIGMVDSKEFAEGIFDALARRRRQNLERITKEELYDFWLQISDQSFDARLQIFFDMVDTNVDGRITREEVQELIVLSASANKLAKLKEQAEEYAALIMEELDPENLGYIELWQLETLLLQRDTYMTYSRPLSTASGAQWSQNLGAGAAPAAGGAASKGEEDDSSGPQTWGEGMRERRRGWGRGVAKAASHVRVAAEENWRRAWVLALWFAAMAALFVWKFVQYRRTAAFQVMGYCLPTAKGAAETLKLNMALVLLPVCRNTLTWLRSSWARFFVPFDDNITFHKMIATAIVVGITLHAGNHLACDFPRVIASGPEEYRLVAGAFGASKPTYGRLISGVEGVTGIAMVVLMTVSFTLATHPFRKGEKEASASRLPAPLNRLAGFNAFWYSHHLLGFVYLLLLAHGYFLFLVRRWYEKTTWMYISVPLLLYVGERMLRALRSNAHPVKILKGKVLPLLSDVGSNPSAIDYYSHVASNLAGAGRLGDFLIAAEGLRAASGDAGFAARINWRLLSRGVVAALREHGLPHVLEFLRDADRIGVDAAVMLDADASDAVAAACRQLLDERIMVEFVEAIEALATCGFFVKSIVDPMDVLKIFVRKRDPDMAIRYARIFPHSQLLLCNTMEAFGKRKELKHALKVFGALKDQLGGINMFACRSIIDICSHCGSSVQARIIFEGLLAEKITPNTHVFNSLMNANAHSMTYNFSVYKHMQKLGVRPDLASYNILLKTCCNAREFNTAQEIYEEMKKKEHDGILKLDVFTYSTMMKVFAEAKMWKMASNIKDDMRAVGARLNLVTWSSLINAYANSGLVDGAIEILEEMIRDGCQPTAPCFNIILTALVKSCQYDRAFRLFNSWIELGIKVSLSFEQKRSLPDNFTFCEEHPSTNGGTILVVPFRPTVTTYNILMMACGTNDERAKSVMNEMKRNGLCPDRISWSILMDIYGTSRNRNGAIQALRRMQRVGIKLNVSAYTVAIKACVESKDLKLALHLFEEMKAHQLKPNMVTYRTLLTARSKYGSLKEIQKCLAIYQEMRQAGYQAYDYYLKELIVEWSEGVLSSDGGNRNSYHLDQKDERNESFNLFLEKVARFLQKDVDQNQTVDVRGLSKVEARIVVLSTLRKIKEKHLLGRAVQDDLVIITGHEKTSYTDVETTAIDVEHAITAVLTDELGLEVFVGPESRPPVSSKLRAPPRPRRPQGMIKISVNSLNHWLNRKSARDVQ